MRYDAPGSMPAAGATHERRVRPSAFDKIDFDIYEDLRDVEQEWCEFQKSADCTVFQTFQWLSTWRRHVGVHSGVQPVIVVGREANGSILFLLPFAVTKKRLVSELTWLGSDLCDYNAPLLAPNFSHQFPRLLAVSLLRAVFKELQSRPGLGYDIIRLEKMPELVGSQPNPFVYLPCTLNPSGAHMTRLADTWETYYNSKRSTSTRQRDRSKRKRLAELGKLEFVTPATADDIVRTLDTLIEQKSRSFAHMGVANIFALPGYPEFYQAIASDPASRHLIHVSRLDAGPVTTAVNLGLVFRQCYYHLLASYADGDIGRLGPGTAHLHDLMRYAIDHDCKVYDFTIGDEGYKRDWCEIEINLYDHISGASARGAVVAQLIAARRALKRWIKQTPAVWRVATKVREILGSLRSRLRR